MAETSSLLNCRRSNPTTSSNLVLSAEGCRSSTCSLCCSGSAVAELGQSTGAGSDNVACNRAKGLHRLAYPERYRRRQEQNLSAAGFPTVCITACQSRHCFTAMNSRIQPIIFLRIFSTSTTAARLLFMNWSTNCLSRGSRSMNHSTVFSRLHSSPRPVESRHLMSAPAQAVHHPICLGTIMTKINTKTEVQR